MVSNNFVPQTITWTGIFIMKGTVSIVMTAQIQGQYSKRNIQVLYQCKNNTTVLQNNYQTY